MKQYYVKQAQQLVTDTILNALDNAGIQIERVSEEEAWQVLGEKGNAEFAKSRKSRIFVPTSKVPKEELAVAHHALFAKVQDNTKAGVLYYADSANYTHIFVGGRHLCAIKIDGNEEIIKFLEKGIDNGTYRNAADFDRWDEGIGSRKRYDNHFNASSSRQRGGNGGTDILYQGQSTDTERNRSQSVGDSGNTIQLRTGDGIIFGYAQGGKIYLTPEGLNPNTPIHEYTHLWVSAIKRKARDLYGNLQDLFSRKNLPDMWAELDRDPHYAHLSDEAKLSEIIARFSGKRGAERFRQEAERILQDKNISAYARTLIVRKEKMSTRRECVGDRVGRRAVRNGECKFDRF